MNTKLKSVLGNIFRWSYKTVLWLIVLLILIVGITIVLYWQTNIVAKAVEEYINVTLKDKATIKYSKISGSLFNNIEIDNVEFELTNKLKLRSNKIQLGYDIFALWDKKIKVSSLYMDSLYVDLLPQPADTTAKEAFNLDSTLTRLQRSHFLDSLLTKMPQLQLGDFEIKTGYLHFVDKEVTFENIYLRANTFFKPDRFSLELVKFSAYWKEKDFLLDNLEFHVLGNREQVTINKFKVNTGDSYFMLAGDIEVNNLNMVLAIEDFYLDFNSLAGFLPTFKNAGVVSGDLALIGKPQDFGVNGELKGNWKQHFLKQLKVSAAYEYGNIVVDTIQVKSNMGNIFVKADINPLKSARGQLHLSNLNLNKIDTSFSESRLNTDLQFRFPSGSFDINRLARTFKNITGTGSIVIYNSYYDTYKLDSLRFAIKTNRGNLQIEQPSFIKFADQARFDIYGELSKANELDLQVQTDVGDLNSLTSAFGLDSIYGLYYSDFRASGQVSDPTVQGYLWIDKMHYDKVLLDSIGLDFQVSTIISRPFGVANFNIRRGQVYDIPLRNVNLNAAIDSFDINVSNARIFSEDNYIETSLDILAGNDIIQIMVNYLRLEYGTYWLTNDKQIKLEIDSSRVNLKDFSLLGPDNTYLKMNGIYDKKQNDAFMDMDLQSLNLRPFQQFLGAENKTSGILSGKANLQSLLTDPDINVDIEGKDIFFRDVALGNFKADLQYDKEKIFIKEFDLQADSTRLTVAGDLALQFDKNIAEIFDLIKSTQTNLKLELSNVILQNYNSLLPLESPLSGVINGSLELEGTVNDPYMRQSLTLDNFRYQNYKVDSLVMFAQYSAGYITLDSLSAVFNGTSFNLKGYQQLDLGLSGTDTTFSDNPFEFYLTSRGERLDFIGLFNSQLESIHGPYEMEINLTGTPQKPGISSGHIKMDDGTLLLSRIKDPVKDLNVDISIENNLLTINTLEAVSKREQDFWQKAWDFVKKLWSWMLPKAKDKGTMDIAGTVNLENLFKPGVDIQIEMNEFYVDYFVENTKIALTTDNMTIEGRDSYHISGLLTIPYGEYEVNIDQIQKNVYLSETEEDKDSPGITMELEIEIPGNFVVASSALDLQNNFKVSLRGNLQAGIEQGSDNMSLIGVLETESGKFTSFNQSFNVTSGEINFSNPLKINPDLNIVAQKRVDERVFELVITGSLESIQQNINVYGPNGNEIPMTPNDKIALLTLGTQASNLTSNADSTFRGVGEDVATNVVLTAAERGVEELTGFDRVEISSSDKLLDLQKLKLNNGLKQASIAFGKYLTSDLYVEYRTQFGNGVPTPKLSWDAGNKITLQYRIDKNWSLDSHYEKTIPLGNNKVQLGLTWEYTF